ncbi:TonB-dependent receptor [Cytophagaceae bacterium YF14B1]|uniref:TonB-dependent receptor n=1 Tax=Xanthocytophaga flava TaxID=3048013 RepID=A0AAE3QMI3_9BACT|nr:TonB-dependent receptor [Xanthocytophaga flavus]MDJ1482092.1 TonB-dependent receptor [Xanthocytophaga flavus]
MKKTSTYLLFFFFLLIQSVNAQTKTDNGINGNFTNTPFSQFVKEIESQSPYYFYYDAVQLDSFKVTLQVTNLPIQKVLEQVFSDTEFKFSIDAQKRIYIAQDRLIITRLPAGLFDSTPSEKTDATAYDIPDEEREERLLSASENKLYEIGVKTYKLKEGNATISGYVRNAKTGEQIIGAAVYLESPQIGVVTDALGHYSITLPKGKHLLRIKNIGMRDTRRQVMVYSDGKLDIEMLESVVALKEVKVQADRDVNVAGTQMGLEKLSIKTMKQIPTAFGETDLLRVVLTLPGVKSVGESSTGLNVRGGSTSQNLILFDDATVYNPAHLFGFFSAFNPDVIKDVELYKSNIPSKFGGRLSSVLDITGRDGNKKKFVGSGGLGLITSRLAVEGPIVKDKSSFLLGGRSTYSNWVLKALENPNFNKSSASFYDINAHISHEINEKNSVYLTAYLSNDRFRLFGDTLYTYRNILGSLKWKHTFNTKLFGVFSGAYSQYQYAIRGEQTPTTAFDLNFAIYQANLKADFTYLLTDKHTLEFGASTIRYKLSPGSYTPYGEGSLVIPDVMPNEQAQESAIHIGDKFEVSPRLLITAGIRFSVFNYLGPKTVNTYASGYPIETGYMTGTKTYDAGKIIKTYGGPEYRLSARYMLSADMSLKASYNTLRQYIHLITNTTVVSPTDIWKLSDSYLKPQLGSQYSLGLYKNLRGSTIEVSVEGYYKDIRNFLDYKNGDSLILNHHIETAVINTRGKAYGVEVMVKKMSGKLNGWVSYTYSRSLLRAEDRSSSDAPNDGNYYPSNYDKPHDFTLIGNYKFSHRFSTSLNFTYSTGRPYTPPIGKYILEGTERVFYAERNKYRIPDYYRVDFSMNIEGNHKVKKLAHSSWTLAVYNVLGRKNPYSVYFITKGGSVNGYQLSIFGRPIPTVTYNFRF